MNLKDSYDPTDQDGRWSGLSEIYILESQTQIIKPACFSVPLEIWFYRGHIMHIS